MGRATWIALAMLGCSMPSQPMMPTGSVTEAAASRGSVGPWQLATRDLDLIDVVDRRVIVWDRDWDGGRGGLAEVSALDGTRLRTRPIAGVARNGGLRLWRAVPGGYLAFWDRPARIAENGDALALAWSAAAGDWSTEHAVVDGAAIFGAVGSAPAVVRLALDDGREVWRAALPTGSEDVTVTSDGELVYATWREPGEGRRIRALDPATGRTRWTHLVAASPGALAVAHGILVAALGGELVFVDGPTGRERARVALGHPDVYPALRIDRGRAYIAYDDAVAALTLATGQSLWRVPVALDGGARLAIVGDDVVVSTTAATVVALDRGSGEPRWEVGLGLRPLALVATTAALVAIGNDGATGFGLPVRFSVKAAHLHGRLVAGGCGPPDGAIVTVGATRVALDAAGRYTARVATRGFVTISAAPAHPSSASAPSTAIVRLDGRGDYRVPDLTAGRCDQD